MMVLFMMSPKASMMVMLALETETSETLSSREPDPRPTEARALRK